MHSLLFLLLALFLVSTAQAADSRRAGVPAREDPFLAAVAEVGDPALEEAIIQAVSDLFAERYREANTSLEIILSGDGSERLGTTLREHLMLMNGLALGGMGDCDRATALYDALLEDFGGLNGTERRDEVCSLLSLKMDVLEMGGDEAGVLEVADIMLAVFAEDGDPAIRWRVNMALHRKARILKTHGDRNGALASYRMYRDRLAREGENGQKLAAVEGEIRALLEEDSAAGPHER